MQTRWIRLALIIVVFGAAGTDVLGQGFRRGQGPGRRGGPGTPGGNRLESSGLKVGSPMPEATVFDEEGKPFETASLKGKYSVVVFGCLT